MSERTPKKSGLGIGSLMIYTLVLCAIGFVAYKYIKNKPLSSSSKGDYTVAVPKEMQVKYVPKDFEYTIDDEETIITLTNPRRYRRQFNELVYDFNMSMLNHVAGRMDVPDSLMSKVAIEYEKHHEYLKDLYYQDYLAIKDTSANVYEDWYETGSTTAVDALNEVASKYTCFLVNHVISTLVKNDKGVIYGNGRQVDDPCLIATTEALRPMMQRLAERASIDDFAKAKGLLEEKVEKVIAELATMEVRNKKGLSKQLQTKIMGYSVSSTEVEVSAISILKVGYKLNKFFDLSVNKQNRTVSITLPEPEILSHEVYPKVDKLDVGWMRELSSDDLNKNFNLLRGEFRREALDSDIMDKSKTQVEELMNLVLGPLVASLGSNYKLRVQYQKEPSSIPDSAVRQRNLDS